MYFCLRVDLDYVPWDTPDAAEFGHGEPAVLIRLLELARQTGFRFQFFISNRVLRAFPTSGEAVLNDGHDLDWLDKHPENQSWRFDEALQLFQEVGHQPRGLSVRGAWPGADVPAPPGMTFLSAQAGPCPPDVALFPVETRPDREAIRSGMGARKWTDAAKTVVRDAAARQGGVTLAVRPQVLAKYDPHLSHVREVVELAYAVGLPVLSLRQLASPETR